MPGVVPLVCDAASDALGRYPFGSYGPAAGTFANVAVCRFAARAEVFVVAARGGTVPAVAVLVEAIFKGGALLAGGAPVLGYVASGAFVIVAGEAGCTPSGAVESVLPVLAKFVDDGDA